MKILVLNGSPRKNGMVASILKAIVEPIAKEHIVEWVDVSKLKMKFCIGCMACREKERCILPDDDAHIFGKKIQEADALVIGTPTYWGNMTAPLKVLFERNVPVFMGESSKGIPIPRQKRKKAIIVTACTTPWPFNFILPESRGALRALKEVLHYGGYNIVGSIVKPGSKKSREISVLLEKKIIKCSRKMVSNKKFI